MTASCSTNKYQQNLGTLLKNRHSVEDFLRFFQYWMLWEVVKLKVLFNQKLSLNYSVLLGPGVVCSCNVCIRCGHKPSRYNYRSMICWVEFYEFYHFVYKSV